jgi:Cu2+-exporting ATPase
MLCIEQQAQEQGYSLIMIAIDNTLVGMIELEASLRPETTHVIQQLQQQGLDLCIISGDQEGPTRSLAEKLAIKNYFANTLPEGKASLIKQLQDNGKCVCFVGDGINDSIALAQADVSISLSGASSVATDSAQIVLLDANLERLLDLRHITQSMNNNMRRNITISAIPGVVGVGAVFFFHIGITTSSFLYASGLLSGIANTMRPVRTRSTQLISKVK